MKRTILSAIAATMLVATSLCAVQAAPITIQPMHDSQVQSVDWKPGKRVTKHKVFHKHGMKKYVGQKRMVKQGWARGNRVPEWRRHAVYDYRRYHLHEPASGQSWVRVDNEFLLVAISTGLIVGVLAY